MWCQTYRALPSPFWTRQHSKTSPDRLQRQPFVPRTMDFRYDADPTQVWQMLQALVAMIEDSALSAANAFITTLVARRDELLAHATSLSDAVRVSLRLAPPATTSLFGPAAETALAATTDEREARRAMVSLSSRSARFSRGQGRSASRVSCAGKTPTSATDSAQRGRSTTLSRPHMAGEQGYGRGRQSGPRNAGDS